MTRKTAWIYTRIGNSTDENMAMDQQAKSLCEYAATLNLRVEGHASDFGSGTSADRPGLNAVIDAARQGAFDILLVKNVSRLARGVNAMNRLLNFFSEWGIEVYVYHEGNITIHRQSPSFGMIGGIR